MMSAGASVRPGRSWDRAAEGWNRRSHSIRAWLEQATSAMLDSARIEPSAEVLDIAAGAGDQTIDIARLVGPQGRVLATDISAAMLLLAAENARAAGLHNVTTQVADAQALGLNGRNFDAAVCRLGLMFCDAPLVALEQARGALRPGGRLAALVFSQPHCNPCLGIMMSTALRHANLPARSPFAPGSLLSLGQPGLLERLLNEAGFIDVEVRAMSAPFRLPSSHDYIEFVRTSGTPVMEILAPLPRANQRAAWDDMAEQLNVFATPTGWVGPNELLLFAATAPPLSVS